MMLNSATNVKEIKTLEGAVNKNITMNPYDPAMPYRASCYHDNVTNFMVSPQL
jgi:hypothetical protein